MSTLADLTAGLPAQADAHELFPELQQAVGGGPRPLVVIDDDPTGVQTVHDTTVLLTWGEAELRAQLTSTDDLFFVLTNSRSMPSQEAEQVNEQIGQRLLNAARGPFVVASRSDSTLRGHFPVEPLALQRGLHTSFDGYLLVPAFFEGGRYTIDDTHWVATPEATSMELIPASATSFAQDAVFGYSTAFLPAWIEEKSAGRWRKDDVRSIPLRTVRMGAEAVSSALQEIEGGVPVVINVAGYGDLTTFVLGLLEAEVQGKRFLYRTAASFVRVRAGMAARPLLSAAELLEGSGSTGGLVVVGSYQPSSTQQLNELLADSELRPCPIELQVQHVLDGTWSAVRMASAVDTALANQELAVLFTSRTLITGEDNLALGKLVTNALLDVLKHLQNKPRFVIAKGGITSHEIARQGLGATRATVLGQLQPGVPVWRLEGDNRMPYVVFPGNVGGPTGLRDAARTLSSRRS